MSQQALNLKPLIDHAIGALGDLSGEMAMWRQRLHQIKKKTEWTEDEIRSLRAFLENVAAMCSSKLEEWEEITHVKIP